MTRKASISGHEHCECVASLEHDLRDLKRRLATIGGDERTITSGRRNKPDKGDWLDELAPQDAQYFRRRLGLK